MGRIGPGVDFDEGRDPNDPHPGRRQGADGGWYPTTLPQSTCTCELCLVHGKPKRVRESKLRVPSEKEKASIDKFLASLKKKHISE